MKEKAVHNGHCISCGKESKQPFCNRQCYCAYVKTNDPGRNKREQKERAELSDRIIKRNIYIASKGTIKYSDMTPTMINEKRAAILAWRVRKANQQPKPAKSVKHCKICGVEIAKGCYCSDECRKIKARRDSREINKRQRMLILLNGYTCKECGEFFIPEYGSKRRSFCSATCHKRNERRKNHKSHVSYKRCKAERDGERFKVKDIYDRDRWICGICNRKVDRRLKYPHPMSASLDHIIPIADGGAHIRANVQLAHLSCNVETGIGGIKQLRMFG